MNRTNLMRANSRHSYLEDEEFGSDIPFTACRDVTRMSIVQSTSGMFDLSFIGYDLKYYRNKYILFPRYFSR